MTDQKVFDEKSFNNDDISNALKKCLKLRDEFKNNNNEKTLLEFLIEHVKYAKCVKEEILKKIHEIACSMIGQWREKNGVIKPIFEDYAQRIKDGKLNVLHKDVCFVLEKRLRLNLEELKIKEVNNCEKHYKHDFLVLLPRLIEYVDYAKTEKMEKLHKSVQQQIESGTILYLSQLERKDRCRKSLYDVLVNALIVTDYSIKIQKSCDYNIPICKMKRALIDDGYLPILNGKGVGVKKCTAVKSKLFFVAESDTPFKITQKICDKNAKDKEIHASRKCECYCSCQKCWHTVCHVA
jgi:hypothetical protein